MKQRLSAEGTPVWNLRQYTNELNSGLQSLVKKKKKERLWASVRMRYTTRFPECVAPMPLSKPTPQQFQESKIDFEPQSSETGKQLSKVTKTWSCGPPPLGLLSLYSQLEMLQTYLPH